MFIFETIQLIEQLEQIILASEKVNGFDLHAINEIFRTMHTIKGSSAMMIFNNISTVSHSMEDIFYFLREENSENIEWPKLFDLVLEVVDYIKDEINKIKNGDDTATSPEKLLEELKNYLFSLKSQNKSTSIEQGKQTEEKTQNYIDPDKITPNHYQYAYKATIFFDEGCEMENIRAYTIIHNIKDMTDDYYFFPEDIMDNDDTCEQIRKEGFTIYLKTDKSYEEMHAFFMKTIFLRDLELKELENDDEFKRFSKTKEAEGSIVLASDPVKTPKLVDEEKVDNGKDRQVAATTQSFISVNVTKLDQLMDLVGEMVVAEAMVIQNPDLQGLELDNFHKAARQLNKITNVEKLTSNAEEILKFIDEKVSPDYDILEQTGEQYDQDAHFVKTLSEDFATAASQIADSIESIVKSIEQVAATVEEANASSQEISSNASESTRALEEVAKTAQSQAEMAEKLMHLVEKFRV